MDVAGLSRNPKVMVGIPAHNEGRSIAAVVSRSLPHAALVVVVDDGSTDATAAEARRAGATVLRQERNGGKGAAVAVLFEQAVRVGADVLVLIDGDGQHDPAEIPALVGPCLADGADVVVGSRYLEVRSAIPPHRSVGQRFFNLATAVASGVPCSDSQSGFRAFNRRAVCAMRLTEASFSVECEQQFECRIRGLRLTEVAINCRYDAPPKRSAWAQGARVLTRLAAMTAERRILQRRPAGAPAPVGLVGLVPEEELEPVVGLAAD